MFRTTVLLVARSASQCIARQSATTIRPLARPSLLQPRQVLPTGSTPAVRWYAAHGGLSEQEVTGRILNLLKNFDKVRYEEQ